MRTPWRRAALPSRHAAVWLCVVGLLAACAGSHGYAPGEDHWAETLRIYSSYYPYKALAIADDGSYGYRYGASTPEEAVSDAIRNCEAYAEIEPSGCQVWALGHRVVHELAPIFFEEEMRQYKTRVLGLDDLDTSGGIGGELRVDRIESYID